MNRVADMTAYLCKSLVCTFVSLSLAAKRIGKDILQGRHVVVRTFVGKEAKGSIQTGTKKNYDDIVTSLVLSPHISKYISIMTDTVVVVLLSKRNSGKWSE